MPAHTGLEDSDLEHNFVYVIFASGIVATVYSLDDRAGSVVAMLA